MTGVSLLLQQFTTPMMNTTTHKDSFHTGFPVVLFLILPSSADVLESFDTHHPLVLPDGDYQFDLRGAVTDSSLREQLDKLKEFISNMSNSQSNEAAATGEHQVSKEHLHLLVHT